MSVKLTERELVMLIAALRIGLEDGSLCNDDPKEEEMAEKLKAKLLAAWESKAKP